MDKQSVIQPPARTQTPSEPLSAWAMFPWTTFFFSSRRRHTRYWRDWSSDVCFPIFGGCEAGVGHRFVRRTGLARRAADRVRPADDAVGDGRLEELLDIGVGLFLVQDALEERGNLATDHGDDRRHGLQCESLHDARGGVDVDPGKQESTCGLRSERSQRV